MGYIIDIYYKVGNITLNKRPYNLFPDFLKNKENYLEKINKENYDLIIASRFGLKFPQLSADIYTIHSHSDLYSQKTKFSVFYNLFKPKQSRIKNEIYNLIKNKDKYFIFCSKQLKDDYCSICELNKAEVIYPYPNFIPLSPLNETDEVKNKEDVYTFGISALGFQNKGGYLILQSALLLKLLNKKFKIKIIYKNPAGFLLSLFINLAGLSKNVQFYNRQQAMHEFFYGIDCLVMASQLESFGMTAVEAVSFGLPVIISSQCGVKEIISQNKNITGYIFDYKHKVWNLFKIMKYVIEHQDKKSEPVYITTKEIYNEKFINKVNSVLKEYSNSR